MIVVFPDFTAARAVRIDTASGGATVYVMLALAIWPSFEIAVTV